MGGLWLQRIIVFPPTTRLTGDSYVRRCLSTVVNELAGQQRIFQQDNATPHKCSGVFSYLRRKNVDFIDNWPPYSPDLNMVELVWPLLNTRVSEQHPTGWESLRTSIHSAWDSIKQEEINDLCLGFQSRVHDVLKQGGSC